ncbi:hypothetical protein [Hypericibacter sp.]|uniref:Tc toxin subunit A-related protein n=1 Tax=Hypericibacter sp. TaxID=2705401 RepID=UPI003D6D86C3
MPKGSEKRPPAPPKHQVFDVFIQSDALQIRGRLFHKGSDVALAGLQVEALCRPGAGKKGGKPIGSAVSGPDGQFQIDLDRGGMAGLPVFLCNSSDAVLAMRVADGDGTALADVDLRIVATPASPIEIPLSAGEAPKKPSLGVLADFLTASRRVRMNEVAADLGAPAPDSPLQAFSVRARIGLLDKLAAIKPDPRLDFRGETSDGPGLLADTRLIDPKKLRDGKYEISDQPEIDIWKLGVDPEYHSPIFGNLPWARPDDESYRDYLRGVFVLYAHQQAVGFSGNLTQWTTIIERQLVRRFFQDFRTQNRTEISLNKLLIPIVTKILLAPKGNGFGFAVAPASVPGQGTLADRDYLDKLIARAPVTVAEFENRYRLPLGEPDSVLSSAVLLNVYTLKLILSDTAQGPVEPKENIIVPQLPGFEGKPILWDNVVGAAPFFLRFEEWLDRQKPFYPENLFSLRSQIQACVRGEPWMDKKTEDYLNYHRTIAFTQSLTPYNGQFASIGEVHRSAEFLLAFGVADRKLFELITAIDKEEYPKALRLADEAEALLRAAKASPATGENWEPSQSPLSNFPRPMSFAKRRNLAVTDILKLTGVPDDYPATGFERFFELPRLSDLWMDNVSFADARDLATRLVRYQRVFLLPILRGLIYQARGDHAAAINCFATVSGFYVGIAKLATPPGAALNKDHTKDLHAVHWETRKVVYGKDVVDRGDRPYTARLTYDDERYPQSPSPFVSQYTDWGFNNAPNPEMKPTDLHALEVNFLHIVQAEAMLQWAEILYRNDEPSSLERARELYKGVLFLHEEDPGTPAYRAKVLLLPPFGRVSNPRRQNQVGRAQLAMFQLKSGLNFYGYRDDAVPTLRYKTLLDAAGRWSTGAKAAQNDFLAYMTRLEQLDLDIMAAQAQQKKAQASVQIATEQIEIAKNGVVVANRLVKEVQKQIAAKQKEIDDSNSIFSQFKDYFKGMKDSASSLVDVGKTGYEGATGAGLVTDAEAKTAVQGLGSDAAAGTGVGAAGVVGAFAVFAVLSTITLQGMADAATKRDAELKALSGEALPAAQAAVRVQERLVTIAQLQGVIASTELAYTNDLVNFQAERFLNRDFWQSLANVASRVMRRQLDLAAQASWFAERALAYQIGRAIRIIRLNYFDVRMRDVTGVDRLMLDLAELEAVRLASARLVLPIKRTYSLARDLPLAYGALKRTGSCRFTLTDDDLRLSHPGTFAHRIRAVDVATEAPGAVPAPRGVLSNRGLSYLRPSLTGPGQPLIRYEDALPISEFRMRTDMTIHDMPGEQLMPFEGSGFTTEWMLEFPVAANATGLSRLTDVLLIFDIQANFDGSPPPAGPAPGPISRAFFASALSLDTAGLGTMRGAAASGKVRFKTADLSIPGAAAAPKVTNIAVLLPGVDSGSFTAKLRAGAATIPFTIKDGIATSNAAHLSDGVAANAQPLNAIAGAKAVQDFEIEITKGSNGPLLATTRDVLLWLEYEHPA